MNILLIYPNIAKGGYSCPHFGLASISATLKANLHTVNFLNIMRLKENKIKRKIKKLKPDFVGLTCTTHHWDEVKLLIRWIKEVGKIITVVGGSHPTICSKEVLKNKNIDYVIRGDGERAFAELLDCFEGLIDISDVNNISYRCKDKIIENKIELIGDLDKLPFIDRTLDLYVKRKKVAHMMAGRGCPYDCTYCCNHVLRSIYKVKKYVRYRSPEKVVQELKLLKEKYKIRRVDFHDDTFTLSKKWLKDFCNLYKEIDLPFFCNSRPEIFNSEKAKLLRDAKCDMIRIGLESGNEWLRTKILNRNITNEQIIKACSIAKENGIKVRTFNMIGLPFETEETIEETYNLNKAIKPDQMHVSIFYPYPKTILYQICEEQGFLTDKKKKDFFSNGTTLNLPTLSEEKINFHFRRLKKLRGSF